MAKARPAKPAVRPKPTSAQLLIDPPAAPKSLTDLIDELGEIRRQKQLWKPPLNPYLPREAALLAALSARFRDLKPEEQAIEDGAFYQLQVTAQEFRQELNGDHQRQALEALENAHTPILDVFSTTLSAIRKCKSLGQRWLDQHVPKERKGPREYRTTALAPASRPNKAA